MGGVWQCRQVRWVGLMLFIDNLFKGTTQAHIEFMMGWNLQHRGYESSG